VTDDRASATSLTAVRAVIPPGCYERSTARGLAAVGQAAALHVAAIVGLLLTDTWWILLPLWALAGLGVAGLFVLGHDASHGALVTSPRQNRFLARLCMLPSGHVEAAWALGHNRIHHGYTAREGFDFVWEPLTPTEYRNLDRRGRARHRFEWSCVGAGAYYLRAVWWQKMVRFAATGSRAAAVQRDKRIASVASALVVVAAASWGWYVGGAAHAVWIPIKIVVIPFLVFAHIIGWTVYVHHIAPDIRWAARREWSQFKAQMTSTTILRMPAPVNWLWFHNIFVHVPHHVDVRIPFYRLPVAGRALASAFPELVRVRRLSLRSYLRATRTCKLFDFQQGEWLPYDAAMVRRH
jgi:omega-6 fatty acid desaturase (delta-12 desaturase)